ncbi:MAG: siphovirus Gp157 family protein [Firmicutes bacterium]|nr:siphovirus Gp157 family protein [Bacillota bacterium]
MSEALYVIKEKYLHALNNIQIDEDTGEVIGAEALDDIDDCFEDKAENIACFVKDLRNLSDDIAKEQKALAERKKSIDAKVDRLNTYLSDCFDAIGKDKLETARVKIGFRKSSSVNVSDDFIKWAQDNDRDDLLKYSEPTANKTAIKDAIKRGESFGAAELIERKNIYIK